MLYSNHHATYHQNIDQSSQQQQSSCSQCKRNNYGIREQQQQDESSLQVPQRKNTTQSSQDEASVPIRKQIVQKNYQFEQMLKLLQYEVDSLKKQNSTKDLIINELKFQVHKSAVQEQRKLQNNKQAYEINRLRQQLGCSPRSNLQMNGKLFKGSSSFQQSTLPQGYENSSNNYSLQQPYNRQKHSVNQAQYMQPIIPRSYDQRKQQNTTDYDLRITILQKQIREYQLQVLQQKQKLTQLQEQTKWQQKFINSFIKMCDQLSLNYGQKLKLNKLGDDFKKKTKISWNYMKNLIGYFIQNNNSTDQTVQNG